MGARLSRRRRRRSAADGVGGKHVAGARNFGSGVGSVVLLSRADCGLALISPCGCGLAVLHRHRAGLHAVGANAAPGSPANAFQATLRWSLAWRISWLHEVARRRSWPVRRTK